MRDIGRRIQRYRLSRYARPEGGGFRVPRWAWIALAVWLLWAGVVSEHSFYQLWRVRHMATREHEQLLETQAEVERLEGEAKDPQARKLEAERLLREQDGWSRKDEIIFRIDGADTTRHGD